MLFAIRICAGTVCRDQADAPVVSMCYRSLSYLGTLADIRFAWPEASLGGQRPPEVPPDGLSVCTDSKHSPARFFMLPPGAGASPPGRTAPWSAPPGRER